MPQTKKQFKSSPTSSLKKLQELNRLVSVGDATLRDFGLLGIETLEDLACCDATDLYDRLCQSKGAKLDPCCEDIFQAAIEQAKNPHLAEEKKSWWYWSKKRKERASVKKKKSDGAAN